MPYLLPHGLPLLVADDEVVAVQQPLGHLLAAEGIAVDAQVRIGVDGEVLHLDTVAPEVRLKGHRPHDGEIAHTGVAVHVVGDLAVGELAGDLLVAHDVVLLDAVLALKLLPRYPVQSLLDELRVSDLLLLGVLVLLCFHMKII